MAITMAISAMGGPGTTADVFQAGDHYVAVGSDGVLALWEESNGQPGLQWAPVVILGVTVAGADHRVHF